jgi:hypothetical protein
VTFKTRSPEKAQPNRDSSRGFVLLYVVYVVMAVGLFIAAATVFLGNSIHRAKVELGRNGQVMNVARAGLADAANWFKVQAIQPVRSNGTSYLFPDQAFDPQTSADPKHNYTIDPTIGIVKEYALTDDGLLWARYEVQKQVANNASNAALTDSNAVHDITTQLARGNAGDGLAWYLQARGYIYAKRNDAVAYNVSPNQVMENITMAEEIPAISIKRPAESAIICGTASGISIGSNARITGMPNGYAMVYHQGTGIPSPSTAPSSCTGSPSAYLQLPDSLWFDDVHGIFGVSQTELKALASISVSSVAGLPATMPTMAIIYINGNATFTPSRPLAGGGILFVNGDLTIQANSNALYSGFVYCTGHVYQYAPSLISGMVVAHGGYTISGTNDVSQVEYSPTVLNTVRNQLCQYQEAKAPYVVR